MNIIAHLNDTAFQSLLISSIETFPSDYIRARAGADKSRHKKKHKLCKHEGEAFGLLFGQRMVKKEELIFNVTLAVPMQAAVHRKDQVTFSPPHFRRIREVTESFPSLEFLGTFHSHPYPQEDYNGKPTSDFSAGDELSAIGLASEYGDDPLEVILGITALKNHIAGPAKANGETIQSYCGRFKYSLSAYCTLGAADLDEDEDDDEDELDEDDLDFEPDDDEEWEDDEDEEDDDEAFEIGLVPVDRLICPLAAHGGGIFGRMEL